MRSLFHRLTVVTSLVLAASCASASGANQTSTRRDSNLITREQLTARSFANAYDAVQTLNSNWLVLRGPDSITSPSQIWVYLDENRLGGIETLRTIAVADVTWIRRIDAVAATSRWGLGHGAGVIQVSTRDR
jgi:hypothetical protein